MYSYVDGFHGDASAVAAASMTSTSFVNKSPGSQTIKPKSAGFQTLQPQPRSNLVPRRRISDPFSVSVCVAVAYLSVFGLKLNVDSAVS